MAGRVGSQTLSTARSSKFGESEKGFMNVISGTVREGCLKVAYADSSISTCPFLPDRPEERRVLYAVDVGRAERNRKLEPKSIVRSKLESLEFQCSKGKPCAVSGGEEEIVLYSEQADEDSKVANCLVNDYPEVSKWYLEDYMILETSKELKTFAKKRNNRKHPEAEQTDSYGSYGTDGETAAGRMANMAKFQSISQDQSAYNHWVGQMRVQLKTFAKQCKTREYPESEQTDSYGTDGETAGRMATSAKFQFISQDQSAYNHWVGQMRVQLKTLAKQCKTREYPESEQTDSYGTDGETAGRMATNAKFQSISPDQSAYKHWVGQIRVQLKTFAKQCKTREYPESEQTDSYGTDGETAAGRMATMAKFQCISQDQSAYKHWVGQMRVQLKTFAKQCTTREYPESEQTTDGETAGRMATSAKFQFISQDQSAYNHWVGHMRVRLNTFAKQHKTREYPESEQTDGYGTDGETAARMATSVKFQSISQDQSAYNHWVGRMRVQLNTFAKQRKTREYPESEQTDSYGTDGETAGRMATMAKFQSISQDQSAYNHWVGHMRARLNTFAKQHKTREYPESEQTDGYGTDGETAGRMATSVKFQSISQDQSAYNHWVGQMRVQLKTFAKQCKTREYPESEQTDSYGTDGETAGRMATSAKFQSISQDQSAYNHWVGQMRVQLNAFAKQRKNREYPESEQTDGYGTDGKTAGRMATSAKFQSISQDQSAYNHWVGQMRVQLNTFAKQHENREYPESEQTGMAQMERLLAAWPPVLSFNAFCKTNRPTIIGCSRNPLPRNAKIESIQCQSKPTAMAQMERLLAVWPPWPSFNAFHKTNRPTSIG